MENLFELIRLNCASCGAPIENFQGRTEIVCDYCHNTTQIIRPIPINKNIVTLSENDSSRFDNYISIMNQSMVAGNYKEAYDYCNKALEINPQIAALWENKAICSFWIRSNSEVITTEANEILSYLNAAKKADPNSPTYNNTAFSISSNLFFAVYYRYEKMKYDMYDFEKNKYTSYTLRSLFEIFNYLKLMNICFDIYPETVYLKTAVNELTGLNKAKWIGLDNNNKRVNINFQENSQIDALKTRQIYIKKIQNIEPTYVAPNFPVEPEPIPTLAIVFFFFIALAVIVAISIAIVNG